MKSQKILYKNINKINIDIENDLIHEPIPNVYIKIVKINGRTGFRELTSEEKRYYQEKKKNQILVDSSQYRVLHAKVRKKDY